MSRPSTAATLCLLLIVLSGAVVSEDRGRERWGMEPVAGLVEQSDTLLLGAQALFPSGTAALAGGADAALERLLGRLTEYGEVVAIRVVGHTDSVGRPANNRRLSKRRASAVAGVIAARYPGVPIDIEGAGEESPVASNGTAAGRARNRRVEIHVISVDAGGEAPSRTASRADE